MRETQRKPAWVLGVCRGFSASPTTAGGYFRRLGFLIMEQQRRGGSLLGFRLGLFFWNFFEGVGLVERGGRGGGG